MQNNTAVAHQFIRDTEVLTFIKAQINAGLDALIVNRVQLILQTIRKNGES